MPKSISEDSHKLIKVNRRFTLTDIQLKDFLEVIFLLMKLQMKLLNILVNRMRIK